MPSPSRHAGRPSWGGLWAAAFLLACVTAVCPLLLLLLDGDVPLVFPLGLAVGGGAVLGLLVALRAAGRREEATADAHLRSAQRAEEAANRLRREIVERDERWRAYTEERAKRVEAEAGHLLGTRLPAAVEKQRKIPPPLSEAGPFTGFADTLLTSVREHIVEREESQRLVLVELANRVQTSAHRVQAAAVQLTHRHGDDFDVLESSMRIDHAATQQARHAQSLKVLCGEWPGQQWQNPMALVDVVRAASGRITAYQRVEVTGDPDVGVTATFVEPLIHLIAELLANATEYSPPTTSVPVGVRPVQRGAVIEVDDGGLGLDEYRLAEAREVVSGRRLLDVSEVGEVPQTGFAVVGRFARRHGFNVDLGPSPYGGVRAVLLVPSEALETLDPAGTLPRGRVLPRATPLPRRRDSGQDPGDGTPAPLADDGPRPAATSPATMDAATMDAAVTGAVGADTAVPDTRADRDVQNAQNTRAAHDDQTDRTDRTDRADRAERAERADSPSNPAPDPRWDRDPDPVPESLPPHPAPAGTPGRRRQELPQRRSRRNDYDPAVSLSAAPSAPDCTPDEAGEWMSQFFSGSASASDAPSPSPLPWDEAAAPDGAAALDGATGPGSATGPYVMPPAPGSTEGPH